MVEILNEGRIKQKEATFCLLDQRTFECSWETVKLVAQYKEPGYHKIEIFYFVAAAWLDRAISGVKDEEILRNWWGRDDWQVVRNARGLARAGLFANRFKDELGYASAKPWAIYEKPKGGKTMYYMIHATDHEEAPKLMSRAYRQAVRSEKEIEQLLLELGLDDASA